MLQASLDQVSYQVAEEDLFLEFCIVLEGELEVFGLEVTATTQPATADLEGVCRCVSSNTTGADPRGLLLSIVLNVLKAPHLHFA